MPDTIERVRLRVPVAPEPVEQVSQPAEDIPPLPSEGGGIVLPLAPVRRVPADGVFATVVLSPMRILATMYWARYMYYGKPLVLCDYEVGALQGDAWRNIDARLHYWLKERLSRLPHPAGLYVESEMIAAQATGAGIPARPIPKWLTASDAWNQIVQSAANISAQGMIGMLEGTREKMERRPFITEAGVAAGPRDPEKPEVAAYLYGVVLALDPAAARDPHPKTPQASRR